MEGVEPKKRGTPAKKRGVSDEQICSLTGVSRDGAAFAEVHNMGKPSQDDVENISCHFNNGTFFFIDGTNCYDRLVNEKEGRSRKLIMTKGGLTQQFPAIAREKTRQAVDVLLLC